MESLQPLIITSLLIAIVPTILLVATCYLKVSIVLSMIKNGLGTNNTPGVISTIALSLVLTGYIMEPVFSEVFEQYKIHHPKKWDVISDKKSQEAFLKITKPLVDFFDKHSGEKEKKLFIEIRQDRKLNIDSFAVLLPAFTLTELKEAFQMSCYLLLPFLVVDLLVASILGGMGLYMVSPISIALPLKLLLFVASDCWLILTKSLVISYQ